MHTAEVLSGIARLAIAAPRRVIAVAMLVMICAALFGIPVLKKLSGGGGTDPAAESSQASALLSHKFDQGDMGMVITVTADGGAQGSRARAVGTDIVARLQNTANVVQVRSAWTVPPAAAHSYISNDGRTGLIVAALSGGETKALTNAKRLAEELVYDRDGVTVRAGGDATVLWQVNAQTQKDLLLMETVALPLSFLVLVWVFGGLLAAALPAAVGMFAILGALASLRTISLFTNVSIFALNLTVAMGLALAVDYTLLILSRFRDELAAGQTRDAALLRTMTTAGRTVLFSALTVALSMAAMVLFPQYFLKSFAYAGTAVVAFAAVAAIIVAPAAIVLLDRRLDSFDIRRWLRRILRRPPPQPTPFDRWFWYRWTKFVMRHAAPIGIGITALLVLLGSPFADARWGFADDRILPASASAHQVGDQLRNNFGGSAVPDITVVLPDTSGLRPADLDDYAAALSRVPEVSSVSAPGGMFVGGRAAGPPAGATGSKDGSAFITVRTTAPLYTAASRAQLDRLHAVPTPAGRAVQLTGIAQSNRDSVHAIASRLPLVLALIAVITLVLVFLLTGSAVLPVKAVLMNTLSLTAAFGALVWVFQEGHLGGLGTAATGTLGVELPVLLFCIAFGLSMDYEVFLISRIREYWLASHRGFGANDESVARGVAHTARVITAAALIMTISFAALMAAQVSFMRLFGFGLTVAVLADATLVRMLLVPAFMHVLGRANWWAPKPLVRLHDRFGLSESPRETPVAGPRQEVGRPLAAALVVIVVAAAVGVTGYLLWPKPGVTATPISTPTRTAAQQTSPPATPVRQPKIAVAQLGSILLTPAEADSIMGATGMQDQGSFVGADTNVFTLSNPDCLGAAHIVQASVYRDSGHVAIKADVLHEPGNRYTHDIEQAVASFTSAEQAAAFVEKSAATWQGCAGQTVTDTLNGNVSHWSFGPLVREATTIALLYAKQNARGWSCQRALSAVLNLVIDVKACGYRIGDQGLRAVDKIADKATA